METVKAIRFKAEGFVNSFRISQTAVYQLTGLVPTKTNIVGMLANISGKFEKDYYEMLKEIKVGIIPLDINSHFVDLWGYKKFKKGNYGRAVLKREKLYLPKYLIYVLTNNDLSEYLLECLKNPKRIPSLGMDDELANIKNVKKISMDKIKSREVHSIFIHDPDNGMESVNVSDHFWGRKFTSMPLDFDPETPRKGKDMVTIVEFCGLKFKLDKPIEVYCDKEKGHNIQFI